MLLAPGQILLLERGKWTHNRLLRFVLDDILGRRETPTCKPPQPSSTATAFSPPKA